MFTVIIILNVPKKCWDSLISPVLLSLLLSHDQCHVQIRKDKSAPVSDENGVGIGCWENGIFIRGFVRLRFLVWGQDRLQRHTHSIRAKLMRIICYQRVRGHGWGHLIPQKDESIQNDAAEFTSLYRNHKIRMFTSLVAYFCPDLRWNLDGTLGSLQKQKTYPNWVLMDQASKENYDLIQLACCPVNGVSDGLHSSCL